LLSCPPLKQKAGSAADRARRRNVRTFPLLILLSFVAVMSAANVAVAAPPATAADMRAAVQRSLPYIEKVGVAWMNERKCNSCHAVTFMVWSHNEAAAHGLDVNRAKLAEWTNWSLADSLSDRRWFKLRPASIDALKAAGLSDAVLAKLKPLIGKTYLTEAERDKALKAALGEEDFARHRDAVIAQARLPNDGGGADTLAQLLLGRAAQPEPAVKTQDYAVVRSMLLDWRQPDGAWLAAGQLPGLKWSSPAEMNRATTLWSILALSRATDSGGDAAANQRGALQSQKESEPGVTIQSLALRAIVAHDFDGADAVRAKTLAAELLARQNPDGGWSWTTERKTSEAFSTGQALWALGRDGADPAVQRAWKFLLATQSPDGSWPVPQEAINTRPRKLNVYNYWGTAWSAIGILRTLPG
jgi:hypothetical protein